MAQPLNLSGKASISITQTILVLIDTLNIIIINITYILIIPTYFY